MILEGWHIRISAWARQPGRQRLLLALGAAGGGLALLALGLGLGVALDLMLSAPAAPQQRAADPPASRHAPLLSHRPSQPWPIYEDFSQAPEGPSDHRRPASILDPPATAEDSAEAPPELARLLPPSRPEDRPQSRPSPPPAEPQTQPPWRRNAVAVVAEPGRAMVAIVIDDMGLDRKRTDAVIALPGPLTTAFLAYADHLPEQAARARRAGHELMVHLPMEPTGRGIDPGPGALMVDMDPLAISAALARALEGFGGFVGLNNHMGSRFTAQADPMRVVLSEVKRRGLLWLDSRTTPDSVAIEEARRLGVPLAVRDVFLDHREGRQVVRTQLAQLERIARAHGYAVAIGHPRDATITELAGWIDRLPDKGLQLVPISAIVARHGLAASPELAAGPDQP